MCDCPNDTAITIESMGVVDKKYIDTIEHWRTCSDEDVASFKQYFRSIIGSHFKDGYSEGPLRVSRHSGMIYLVSPLGSDETIAFHSKKNTFGIIKETIDQVFDNYTFVIIS